MFNYYVYINRTLVGTNDSSIFSTWLIGADRKVACDKINDCEVSTVFLGVNHNFTGKGKPILWETMVFGEAYDDFCKRYTSRLAAIRGHNKICRMIKQEGEEI